jgi:hypothetical protein
MSGPYYYFKRMTLDEFRSKFTRNTAHGEEWYVCPMCGSSTLIKGLRERCAKAFDVTKSSLDFVDDVELVYRACLQTARIAGIIE